MAQYPTDTDIDTTFPDNTTGDIGADDMRTFQKQMTAAGKDYLAITENVPTSFPPSAHTHETSEVNGLDTALAMKSQIGHTHEADDVDGLIDGFDQLYDAVGERVYGPGLKIEVVAALPGTPDPNTIYFVTG